MEMLGYRRYLAWQSLHSGTDDDHAVGVTLCYTMLQVLDGGVGLQKVPGTAEQSLHVRVDGSHSDGVTFHDTMLHCGTGT